MASVDLWAVASVVPRPVGIALVSRRHIDLQRVAGALCPR